MDEDYKRHQEDNAVADKVMMSFPQPEVKKVVDVMRLLGVHCSSTRCDVSVEWQCSRTVVNAAEREVMAYWMAVPFAAVFIFKNGNSQYQAYSISRLSPYRPEFSSTKELGVWEAIDFIKEHHGMVRDEAEMMRKCYGEELCRVRMTHVCEVEYLQVRLGERKRVQEVCMMTKKGIVWYKPGAWYNDIMYMWAAEWLSAVDFMERRIVFPGSEKYMEGDFYIQEDAIPTDVLESIKARALSEKL